mgnify:CR=1 FL=1
MKKTTTPYAFSTLLAVPGSLLLFSSPLAALVFEIGDDLKAVSYTHLTLPTTPYV